MKVLLGAQDLGADCQHDFDMPPIWAPLSEEICLSAVVRCLSPLGTPSSVKLLKLSDGTVGNVASLFRHSCGDLCFVRMRHYSQTSEELNNSSIVKTELKNKARLQVA